MTGLTIHEETHKRDRKGASSKNDGLRKYGKEKVPRKSGGPMGKWKRAEEKKKDATNENVVLISDELPVAITMIQEPWHAVLDD